MASGSSAVPPLASALPLSAKDLQFVQQAPTFLANGYNVEESYQKRIIAIENLTQIAEYGIPHFIYGHSRKRKES